MPKKTDSREWLYVLEINPGARIKVGRTSDLRARLSTHSANADFGGGEITQIFSALCPGVRIAEFELIAQVAARPQAEVVQGREMFAGVPFGIAARLAETIARQCRRKAEPVIDASRGGLLDDCLAAFNGEERIHIETLRQRLIDAHPDMYRTLTVLTLGSSLRDGGIRTRDVRLGVTVRRGFLISDFTAVRPGETGSAG